MEPQPDPAARSPHLNGVLARLSARLDWYWTLSPPGRAAFWATFGGWALDAYNQMTVGFVLPAVTAAFALSPAQAGLLGSVGLVTSAVGGAVAGALADALGRVRVLILSIASYALFTLLAGCAQSYEQLLVFLTLQGLGFGGEWAAGAVLVAEYADATQRGRVVGSVQSAWSIGYAGVLLANTITFSLAPPELAWRIMFWLGALPAVALLWVRTGIEESPLYRAEVAARARGTGTRHGAKPGAALLGLFRRDQLRVTLASALLSVGVIGAGLVIWLPTYLEEVRHLTVEGIGAYMGIQVIGGFMGCISAGYVLDALGRRRGLALFALGSALSAWAYVVLPRRHPLAGVRHRLPARLLRLGHLQRARGLPRRALSDRAARRGPGLRLQHRPWHRRGRAGRDRRCGGAVRAERRAGAGGHQLRALPRRAHLPAGDAREAAERVRLSGLRASPHRRKREHRPMVFRPRIAVKLTEGGTKGNIVS